MTVTSRRDGQKTLELIREIYPDEFEILGLSLCEAVAHGRKTYEPQSIRLLAFPVDLETISNAATLIHLTVLTVSAFYASRKETRQASENLVQDNDPVITKLKKEILALEEVKSICEKGLNHFDLVIERAIEIKIEMIRNEMETGE